MDEFYNLDFHCQVRSLNQMLLQAIFVVQLSQTKFTVSTVSRLIYWNNEVVIHRKTWHFCLFILQAINIGTLWSITSHKIIHWLCEVDNLRSRYYRLHHIGSDPAAESLRYSAPYWPGAMRASVELLKINMHQIIRLTLVLSGYRVWSEEHWGAAKLFCSQRTEWPKDYKTWYCKPAYKVLKNQVETRWICSISQNYPVK